MRKAILAYVVLALVWAVFGLGSGGDSEATESHRTAVEVSEVTGLPIAAAEDQGRLSDDKFVAQLRNEHPNAAYVTQYRTVKFSINVCNILRNGGDAIDVAERIAKNTFTTDMAAVMGTIAAAGADNYCPQYLGELATAEVDTSS